MDEPMVDLMVVYLASSKAERSVKQLAAWKVVLWVDLKAVQTVVRWVACLVGHWVVQKVVKKVETRAEPMAVDWVACSAAMRAAQKDGAKAESMVVHWAVLMVVLKAAHSAGWLAAYLVAWRVDLLAVR